MIDLHKTGRYILTRMEKFAAFVTIDEQAGT